MLGKIDKLIIMIMFSVLILFPVCIKAEEKDKDTDDNITYDNKTETEKPKVDIADVYELDDLVVKGKVQKSEVGKTEISREFIKAMPKGNGSITDLLQFAPGVQFDESYRNPSSAGEIAPADISISGGKAYENLFLIDGMNNSSMLDPGSRDPYQANDVPGHAQKYFLDSWIVEDISVYDSNVPASYDGFTGGVVDVTTKRPEKEFSGRLSYRTGRSEWVNYHMSSEEKERYKAINRFGDKPKFKKEFFSASFSVPVAKDLGIIASYNRSISNIPQSYFDKWKDQERKSETYYLKSVYNIDGASYVDVSASYSPYEGTYFLSDTKDSNFTIKGGGAFVSGNYSKESTGGGSIKLHADYSYSENTRKAPNAFKSWAATKYKPWGALLGFDTGTDNMSTSNEGGRGSIDKEERVAKLNLDNVAGKVKFLGEHSLGYGFALSHTTGNYKRRKDAFSYDSVTLSKSVICGGDDENCVDGDQYFSGRTVTPSADVDARVSTYAAYAEDSWTIKRLDLRLGVRVTNDDYMNNTNIAPRTQIQYDLLGNDATVFTAGYSRYYSANLLANKLREGQRPTYKQNRSKYMNVVQDWQTSVDGVKTTYNFKELKTPYSDEYMTGYDQILFGSHFGLKYIERHNKDEFASDRTVANNGVTYYRLNNNGSSEYKAVQFKWSKNWKNHNLMFNATWQESKTSNDNYNDIYGLEELEDIIIFEGKQIKRHELPRDNFNRPWVFNLAYTGKYYKHLTFMSLMKYRTAYKQIDLVDSDYFLGYGEIDPVTGERTRRTTQAYEIKHHSDSLTVDCTVSWEQPIKKHALIITLEVYNLLDAKNKVGSVANSETGQYELGRQFMLGATYKF